MPSLLFVLLVPVATLAAEGSTSRIYDRIAPITVDSALRQKLSTTMTSVRWMSEFQSLLGEAVEKDNTPKLTQIGEYLHDSYEYEKRKSLVPEYASRVNEILPGVSDANRAQLLRSLGRAAFLYDDIDVLPSVDLTRVATAMLGSTESKSVDVSDEAYYWLLRIARVDSTNAPSLQAWATKALEAGSDSVRPGTRSSDWLNAIKLNASYPKYPADQRLAYVDTELPRTEGKSVRELIDLIVAAEKAPPAMGIGSIDRIPIFLNRTLAWRFAPSEIGAVLAFELDHNAQYLPMTLTLCFDPTFRADEEARIIARRFIVEKLRDFAGQSEQTKSFVKELARFSISFRPIFDFESSNQIFASVTQAWPMSDRETRFRAYQMLGMLEKYGENISGTVTNFVKKAALYEQSATYDDEAARKRTLDLLHRLSPSI